MTQSQALTIMKTGANVFVTGPAGSGKTYVINEYIRYLKDHDVAIGITASTGIAATHMGGVTIHSWTGIGVRDRLHEDELAEIAEKSYIKKKIEAAQVLIIDEVSMLHHFRLDLVNRVLKRIKKSEAPFGGLQVILCGDFFQLPPVARMGEPPAHFIYTSDSWKAGKFTVCYLSENYRQTDDISLSILNEIRSGEVSDEAREQLKSRHNVRTRTDIEPTRLYTHNIDVDVVNQTELGKLAEGEAVYDMRTKGKKPLVEALKKSCLAPEFLRLKKGARVMCVKNNFEEGFVNGTLGVVISCGFGADPIIRTGSTPDYPDGRKITIRPAKWTVEDSGKVLAELEQYPLRLAWAITVHKSQGMSLDAIEVDLSKSFEPGMGYVALSRVRTLAGLTILGINENALKVHPDVLEYDHHLRELSAKAESILSHTDERVVESKQVEFLAKVAPYHALRRKGEKGNREKKIKPPKITTYEKTALLVQAQKPLREIAKERGFVVETIIAQLEKIVEDNLPVDLAYLKYEISPQHWGKIEKALEEVADKQGDEKPPLLSPVKSKVGANISFNNIRLARVLLGYIRKKV